MRLCDGVGGHARMRGGIAACPAACIHLPCLASLVGPCRDFILSVAAAEEEEKQRAEAEAAAAVAASRRSSRRLSVALLQGRHSSLAAGDGARRAGAASKGGNRGGGAASPVPPIHASFLDSLSHEERRIIGELPMPNYAGPEEDWCALQRLR